MSDLAAALPWYLVLGFGLVYGFAGARWLKAMLVGLGVVGGMALGGVLGAVVSGGNPLIALLGALLGALAGGLLFGLVYRLAIFLAGAAAGSALAPALLPLLGLGTDSLAGGAMVALLAVVVGLLALLCERQVMIVVSATLGALLATVSLQLLVRQDFPVDGEALAAAYQRVLARQWWLALLLVAGGILWQWRPRGGGQAGKGATKSAAKR